MQMNEVQKQCLAAFLYDRWDSASILSPAEFKVWLDEFDSLSVEQKRACIQEGDFPPSVPPPDEPDET